MFELHIFEMKILKTPFRKNGILTKVLSPYFLASLGPSYASVSDKTTYTTKIRQVLSAEIKSRVPAKKNKNITRKRGNQTAVGQSADTSSSSPLAQLPVYRRIKLRTKQFRSQKARLQAQKMNNLLITVSEKPERGQV